MKRLLMLAAAGEAALGLVLLVHPPVVVRLLFGAEIVGAGIVMSRIAGIALMALGLACWPVSDAGGHATRAVPAMLCYSAIATFYLAYLGIGGGGVGSLLWPAAAIHAVLTVLLAKTWSGARRVPAGVNR